MSVHYGTFWASALQDTETLASDPETCNVLHTTNAELH